MRKNPPYIPKSKPRMTSTRSKFMGHPFASNLERARAEELETLKLAGNIIGWSPHPRLMLVPGFYYTPDFIVVNREGLSWFEDTKGHESDRFKAVRRLWEHHGLLQLVILKRAKDKGWEKEVLRGRSV